MGRAPAEHGQQINKAGIIKTQRLKQLAYILQGLHQVLYTYVLTVRVLFCGTRNNGNNGNSCVSDDFLLFLGFFPPILLPCPVFWLVLLYNALLCLVVVYWRPAM